MPLSKVEEKLFQHLAKRKLHNSENDDTLIIRTGGTPTYFMRQVKPKKTSFSVTNRTRRRRSKEKLKFSYNTGEITVEDKKAQFVSDFRTYDKQVKDHVSEEIKNVGVDIDADSTLALKEYADCSWAQLAKFRRFGSERNVRIASEAKCRVVNKSIVDGKVRTTILSVPTETVNGTKITNAQMVYVHDLKEFVFDLLDKYEENGDLTWHDGGIPEDQIWLKIGGDHGKGSMKLCVEVANLLRPNARDNTHLIAKTDVKDTPENLHEISVYFNPELKDLKRSKWRGKKIIVFLFGDYAFL